MNKKFFYYLIAVVLVGGIPGTTYLLRLHFTPKPIVEVCNEDRKTCPDDSTVRRTGPHCEFAACPSFSTSTPSLETSSATSTSGATTSTISENIPKVPTPRKVSPRPASPPPSTFSSIITAVVSPFKKVVNIFTPPSPPATPSSTYISNQTDNNSTYKPSLPEKFAGEKFVVKDGNIFTSDDKIVYNIPQNVIDAVGSSNPGWTNTTINVIQVGSVAPILNAIPIKDLPGKYYLSENSFGNIENCEFSNKIFILDTVANSVELMYEENSDTLSHDDPRACNSEIFLLTTEGPNLILKYHTIQTNTLCDSAWSEPEKTFYLDVTKLRTEGMRKYIIPENLSATAEQEEEACRNSLQSP